MPEELPTPEAVIQRSAFEHLWNELTGEPELHKMLSCDHICDVAVRYIHRLKEEKEALIEQAKQLEWELQAAQEGDYDE